METFESIVQRGGSEAVKTASRFFMMDDPVFEALRAVTQRLAALNIPYCVAGGMAMVAHGYDRTTVQELIGVLKLPKKFAGELNPYVRDKFIELWTAVQQAPPDEQ